MAAVDEDKFRNRDPSFHGTDAPYILPNDSFEHERLVAQHESIVALCGGRLIHAPLPARLRDGARIIDIGCGTGIVTRQLARMFPATAVHGIDLSPVPREPDDAQLPNLAFIRGNFRHLAAPAPVEQGGSKEEASTERASAKERDQGNGQEAGSRPGPGCVDFAYSRLLLCGMTDWPGYVADVFAVLKPGGWAEMGDYVEDVFYGAEAVRDPRPLPREDWAWLRHARAGGLRKGLDLDAGLNIPRYMRDAGFVDVQTWQYRIPFWRRAADELPQAQRIIDFSIGDRYGLYWHMVPKLLEGEGLDADTVASLRDQAQADLEEEVGKEQLFCVTIGRKPEKV